MAPGDLYQAIIDGDVKLVTKLLSEGVLVNETLGLTQGTPLCAAIYSDKLAIVKVLIQAGCDVDCIDVDSEPPLCLAIRKKRLDIVKFLIDSGANVNKKDYVTKKPPLCIAADLGLMQVVDWLVCAGADMSGKDSSDNTVLHIATQKGDLDMMKLLLSSGCPTGVANVAGNLPIHIAACQGDLGAVWLLIGQSDPYPSKPFTTAEILQHIEDGDLTRLQWRKGEMPRQNCQCMKSNTSNKDLQNGAVEKKHEEQHRSTQPGGSEQENVEEAVVKPKEKLDKKTQQHCCKCTSPPHMIDINVGTTFGNDTALHRAVLSDRLNVLKLLVMAGADVNAQNREGQTPLFLACFINKTNLARCLLEAGADPNIAGTKKKFMHNYVLSHKRVLPLGLSALYNNPQLTQLLIDFGATFGHQSSSPYDEINPLLVALHRSATDAALCILQNTQCLGDTFNTNNQSETAKEFLFAVANCERSQLTLAKRLLELGCNVNAQNESWGDTALNHAVSMESPELVALYLENGADWSIRNIDGYNSLHMCVRCDQLDSAKILVAHGADIDEKAHSSRSPDDFVPASPLCLSLDSNSTELAEYFVRIGADLSLESYLFSDQHPDERDLFEQFYEEEEDFMEWLLRLSHSAPSLVSCCVRRVRKHFREHGLPFCNTSNLPLPKTLIDKVLGKDYCVK